MLVDFKEKTFSFFLYVFSVAQQQTRMFKTHRSVGKTGMGKGSLHNSSLEDLRRSVSIYFYQEFTSFIRYQLMHFALLDQRCPYEHAFFWFASYFWNDQVKMIYLYLKKMLNIYVYLSILYIYNIYVHVPCITIWTLTAQYNLIHLCSLLYSEWSQSGLHSLDSNCW